MFFSSLRYVQSNKYKKKPRFFGNDGEISFLFFIQQQLSHLNKQDVQERLLWGTFNPLEFSRALRLFKICCKKPSRGPEEDRKVCSTPTVESRDAGFLDAALKHVDGQHLAPLVIGTDVPVNVAAHLAAPIAVGTLEAWFLPARVQQVPVQAVLPLKAAVAAGTAVVQIEDLDRLQQDALELYNT
ncbi:hypothetical protein EAI_10042 [Harpegnathos saltator]|uniref:Uncharacterized protein n=1 Tax=Harpegnathos saltator TaxID=610380 RepID=E2BJA4_HARSA|nr:hypothetical protein EAI_10042 [Harpegnathos saltator]